MKASIISKIREIYQEKLIDITDYYELSGSMSNKVESEVLSSVYSIISGQIVELILLELDVKDI